MHTLRKRMMHKSRNHTGRLGVEISTCLRARLRGCVTNELSGHRDGCRATKKSTQAAAQSVLHRCAVWSTFGVLEDAGRRALQLQRLLGMGHMGHGGLGTVLGWLVGWCGSVADPISQDQVQYVLRAIGL